MPAFRSSIASLAAALLLYGCGGSGGGGGGGRDGGPGPGPNPPGSAASACQQSFSPERVEAGEDCAPLAGRFCTLASDGNPLTPSEEIPPCDGVTISQHPITAAGFTINYLAIRPSSGTPTSVYLQLHYLGVQVGDYANRVRMTELAKARRALILIPQAPPLLSGLPGSVGAPGLPPVDTDGLTVSRWPTNALEPISQHVELLDAVVNDGRQRFGARSLPLYVGGLSNGAIMGYYYSCARPAQVAAMLAVAGNFGEDLLASCPPLAVVVVHGTADVVTPYLGLGVGAGARRTYNNFKALNGCGGADLVTTIPGALAGDPLAVTFTYTGPCSNGRRMYLVTVEGGGHTWPSMDAGIGGSNFNSFGPISRNWDATLYGYDLLRAAAGR